MYRLAAGPRRILPTAAKMRVHITPVGKFIVLGSRSRCFTVDRLRHRARAPIQGVQAFNLTNQVLTVGANGEEHIHKGHRARIRTRAALPFRVLACR